MTRLLHLAGLAALLAAVAPASAQPDLSPLRLDLVTPLIEEGRWLWMGDSFSAPSPKRVPFAALRTWPLARIGAVAAGPRAAFVGVEMMRAAREVGPEEQYLLAAGSPAARPMGVPVHRMLEWRLPGGHAELGVVGVRLHLLAEGWAGAGGRALAGTVGLRPLLYALPSTQGTVEYGALGALPTAGFALGPEAAGSGDGAPLSVTLDGSGTVHLAGVVARSGPGHYAQYLADNSWSIGGYAADAPPAAPDSVKRFQRGDLASYLAATTLDPGQPTVVALYIGPEGGSLDVLADAFERAIANVRGAFDEAGLPPPVVLLVHPHAIAGRFEAEGLNERFGVAMREAALADEGVAFVSLYLATDGVIFDGRPEAAAWLEASGRASLAFGRFREGELGPIDLVGEHGADLLDPLDLHPTEAGAAFYSALLWEALTGRPYPVPDPPNIDSNPDPDPAISGLLYPNPIRPGGLVTTTSPGAPVYDVRGRRVGRVGGDGVLVAPLASGVYLVGGQRLLVR